MNDFHELLVNRRSIRRYTSEPLTPEQVKLILEAGLLAPTSKSGRPWQFIAVEDKDMLERLAGCNPVAAPPIAGSAL
ncbi:MAG: nitroreductase family protein, partial [Paramuribaculum sp.]|nr:nitroreductase family protein [Paramuribaculum sp.]